ncbi:MAG: division/cell wall cluster transcriptional repressor MraZ [Solirubrobacteraceae bacterium]
MSPTFRGTFEHTLDVKNRLTVPAKYRDALAGKVILALTPVFIEDGSRSLSIWTASGYEEFVEAALKDMNPLSPIAQDLSEWLNANAWDTEMDSANRLMIPGFAKQFAGLEKDVVVTGAGSCLRIWDRAAYTSHSARVLARFPAIGNRFDHAD